VDDGGRGGRRTWPTTPRAHPDLTTYHPHRQLPWNGPVFLLRTRGDRRPSRAPSSARSPSSIGRSRCATRCRCARSSPTD
jgi:hypothetical protein